MIAVDNPHQDHRVVDGYLRSAVIFGCRPNFPKTWLDDPLWSDDEPSHPIVVLDRSTWAAQDWPEYAKPYYDDWELETPESKALFNMLFGVLKNHGLGVVADVMDMVHPDHAKLFLAVAHQGMPESKGQVVVFTHQTSLLTPQLLRRDQIWFADRDRHGSRTLVSLVEYQPVEPPESWEWSYLHGRYGGVPFIDGFSHINGQITLDQPVTIST